MPNPALARKSKNRAERTAHNNLVAEFNELTAAQVSGELVRIDAAERAMGERIAVCKSRLLSVPNGFARLFAGQDRETVAEELRSALSEAVDALTPILPVEVTDKNVIPTRVEVDEDAD